MLSLAGWLGFLCRAFHYNHLNLQLIHLAKKWNYIYRLIKEELKKIKETATHFPQTPAKMPLIFSIWQ
ncbi:hypothetical protein DU86_12455 [Methanosarcina mazei]|uniref:Uncharacterized protein n=2 Tax=Methanosarcina mazei TaxID=2209 RepID=A0A0F8QZM9_METMZ|nr:hypothetical protein MSMAW_0696 [Methanosarcina mazei WWM610]KKG03431.1 hypothetical protein DU31_00400 [Methanosarcina mazei]KKG05998.1 hypothetical protein DU40_17455 [Methanosarcina mazei]KKH39497.1 hypothetical protein DU54_18700 [Methanosarcina mazei]KKH41556.1 hypothetical protein DU50_01030 [Methanosarcina mazei]